MSSCVIGYGRPAYRQEGMTSFREKVLSVTAKIPKGATLTYLQVARLVASPRAYRAVGNILNNNHDPKIPCHRVVRSDGTAGGYNRGTSAKSRRLRQEGVTL